MNIHNTAKNTLLLILCCIFVNTNLFSQINRLAVPAEQYKNTTQLFPVPGSPLKFIPSRLSPKPQYTATVTAAQKTQTNKCNTSVFMMHMTAAPGEKIELIEIQSLPDGRFLIAGNIIRGTKQGFVSIMDNNGTILQSDILTVNNRQVELQQLSVRLTGEIIAGGIIPGSSQVALIWFNFSLNITHTQVIDLPATPTKMKLDLNEDGTIMVAAQQGIDVTYMCLANNGSIKWSGTVNVPELVNLAGYASHNFTYSMLTLNCENAGKKSVLLMGFDNTGKYVKSHYLGNGTDEYLAHDVNTFNSRSIVLGMVKDPSQPIMITRDFISTTETANVEHRFQIPSFMPGFANSCATDNSGDVIAISDAANGNLYFIKQIADYPSAIDFTKQYSIPAGAEVKAVSGSYADGGFLMGLNTSANNELLFVKVDSTGALAGCNFTILQASVTETIYMDNKAVSFLPSFTTVTSSSVTSQQSSENLGSSFDCNQTYCPAEPLADTCMSSYYKTYKSKSFAELFDESYLLRGKNIIVFSSEVDRILNQHNLHTYGMRMFSENGTYKKSINYYYNNESFPFFSSAQVDSAHWVLAFCKYRNDIPVFTFVKINDDFQIEWETSYEAYLNYNLMSSGYYGEILVDQEQNVYMVSSSIGFMETPKVQVMKMNRNGIQQWLKIYDVQTPNVYFFLCNAVATNSSIVVSVEGSPQNTTISIDKTTGNLQKSYQYNFKTSGAVFKRPLAFTGDKILFIGDDYNSRLLIGSFDTLGKPLLFKYENQNFGGPRAATYKNGRFYSVCSYLNNNHLSFAYFSMNGQLQVTDTKEITNNNNGYAYSMNVADNGNIYIAGTYLYGRGAFYANGYLAKLEPGGNLGSCTPAVTAAFTTYPLVISEPAVTVVSKPFTQIISDKITVVTDTTVSNLSGILCGNIELCQSVQVTGTKLVCNPAQQQTYSAIRNNGCSLRPQFVFDTAFIKPGTAVDTAITVSFKKTGKTWIKVLLDAGCHIYSDSIEIEISSSASLPLLGNDTIICPGSSLLLNPGEGFKTYTWQDLSANQTLLVNKGGTYYVSTTNYCGDVAADTIVVKDVLVPALYLGKDTSVCKNDTISFSLPGFTKYNWVANGVVFQDNQLLSLIVTQNTAFSVKAFTKEGCIAQDTVLINAFQPQSFFLGNDTAFCEKEQLKLTVPALYKNYWWSTGVTGVNSITVTQKGMYAVKTQDTNSCFFSDTLQVTAIYTLPSINLGADFDLCKGSSRQLDAGVFNKYLWQDGSVGRKITVVNPGLYWVTVSDNNGCTGNDSVQLKSLLPVPENFLALVDSVCQYEKKTILPLHTFSSYLWSDGSSQSSLTVQSPGYYSLLVKDVNGCTGTDSVLIIQKYCRTGIFFPNAFTPNNDGLNDKYMPVIFGPVLKYRLEIFNRYGQRVFETNNHLAGWDGIYNSLEQDPAVFSYTCTYQLEGGVLTTQKGLVTLIR